MASGFANDARIDLAKAIPMSEVAERLGVSGLRTSGAEMTGPCPLCGGRDRFSINLAKSVFNCRGCGISGDQIQLVRDLQGLDFAGALTWLCGSQEAQGPDLERRRAAARRSNERQKASSEWYRQRARKDAERIWCSAKGNDVSVARAYLRRRGVDPDPWPDCLRFIPDHPYLKKIGKHVRELHRGPAMIAAMLGADGRGSAVHQTWIDLDQRSGKAVIRLGDETLPAKMMRGSKKGSAIPLVTNPGSGVLVMAEGIETTLSALASEALPDASYWAGGDLGNMSGIQRKLEGQRWSGLPDFQDRDAFVPPPWVRRLIFVQDGDSAPAKTRAQLESGLRRAMALRAGLVGEIVHAGDGVDLNDVLLAGEPS